MNYFDTSALIKRFVEEPGSKRVETVLAEEPLLATSKVAYAEVHAGLARKLREKALSATSYRRASRAFDDDPVASFQRCGHRFLNFAAVAQAIGRRFPARLAQRIGLRLAARLGQRSREVGEEHSQ